MPNGAKQILIVDDNQDIRSLIKVCLVNKGYACHTADGAAAAMAVLNEEKIDLALVDIIMPGMTGLSLFKQIKATYPGTAIVFVTSIDDMNLAVDSVKEGVYDYIVKSQIPYRLVQAVEQALERHDANMASHRRLDDLQNLVEHQAAELQLKSKEIVALNKMVNVRMDEAPGQAG